MPKSVPFSYGGAAKSNIYKGIFGACWYSRTAAKTDTLQGGKGGAKGRRMCAVCKPSKKTLKGMDGGVDGEEAEEAQDDARFGVLNPRVDISQMVQATPSLPKFGSSTHMPTNPHRLCLHSMTKRVTNFQTTHASGVVLVPTYTVFQSMKRQGERAAREYTLTHRPHKNLTLKTTRICNSCGTPACKFVFSS